MRLCSCWGTANIGGDAALRHGIVEPLEDKQIEIFMAQREAEVIAEAVARPVPLVVDRPLAGLAGARFDVLIGDDTRAAA